MAKNTIGDFIKGVFPSYINKNTEIFKALFANSEETGTIEKAFNDFEETRKLWCVSASNLYSQSGEQLEKSLRLFSVLKRLTNDTEETYLARVRLLFSRNNDSIWGTYWDILKLFKTFFRNNNVWLVNNTDNFANNMLINGNFENTLGWTLEDCSYEPQARFEETQGVLFNASGTCSQSVTVETDTAYFLHFFLKGNIRVQIQDNNGRFWKNTVGETGNWVSSNTKMSFASENWDSKSLFFITDDTVTTVTITFCYADGFYGFLDYVRLNKKTKTSSFSLIAVFEGVYTEKTAALSPGTNDPVIANDYSHNGFFSPGTDDAEETVPGTLSFFDNGSAAINEDENPVATSGKDDKEPLEGYENMTFIDSDDSALAPKEENEKSIDYDKASYFNDSFIFGASGQSAQEIYQEMLDIVQPAGVTSCVEILTREQYD